MARGFKSNLPKVISKANKDISTIIENDIAKESALLKDLVDQVLKANLEVKKKNNQRITETKRKLAKLEEEIEDLNIKIDLVDRETVIEQLNEMIDAENKIFNAKQEIRFFDHEQLPVRLNSLQSIYDELTASVKSLNSQDETYRTVLKDHNKELFDKQLYVTNSIFKLMDKLFTSKQEYIQGALSDLYSVRSILIEKENELTKTLQSSIDEYQDIILSSSTTFDVSFNVEDLEEQLEQENKAILEDLENQEKHLLEEFNKQKDIIINDYKAFEQSVKDDFESQNKSVLEKEQSEKEKIEEKLKEIRFDIMNAEKTGNIEKVAALMKEFEKVEKKKAQKTTTKVQKATSNKTKKKEKEALDKLKALELQYIKDVNNIQFEQQLQGIKFEESKILGKIQKDYKGLQSDLETNKSRINNLKEFLKFKQVIFKEINDARLQLRLGELDVMQENENKELELIDQFKDLLQQIKTSEAKRNAVLKQNIHANSIIKLEQEYRLNKAKEEIKIDQDINDIDKLILRKRNETLIKNEKLKEELNSEVIYQESLINIAKKEHELQLIKVKSLYENERSLAEEQVERINLGVQVNDTFVKTTLQNQMLFAKQQINCADSEFEIRVESINLTHDQEVQYANKKIEYYRQKYEYDKSKFRKELNDKLEDLNYKLLLFTDEKDNKEISKKIQELTDHYEGLIDEIEQVESNDPEILRYEKVINDAENRQTLAINEAQALREQTVSSFEALYDATKAKYDTIKEENQTEETKGIMPLLNTTATSSADQRLQLAIKEADELLAERTTEPAKIIEETKQKIIEVTNSDETDQFINEQKDIKKAKLKAHKEKLDALQNEYQEQLKPLLLELENLENTEVNVTDEEIIFDYSEYRKKEDIIKDYKVLVDKEKTVHGQYFKDIQEDSKVTLKRFDEILKTTTKMVKKTFKPYSSYIKKSSKTIVKDKKKLKKEYTKKLNKALKDKNKELKTLTI